MPDWDAARYLRFQKERTQPALDLAMRVGDRSPQTIVDIGCGPGNSTGILRVVFQNAKILGIDQSENMIRRAKKDHPDIRFERCDVRSLKGRYDLLFSNACLQWVPDHQSLIPALMEHLHGAGVLAVQMPMNEEEPLFRLIGEMVREPKWQLDGAAGQINGTLRPLEYYDILCACASSFEMWETKYTHALPNHEALVDFVKGSRLRPYLDFLGAEKGKAFERELIERSKALYPVRPDGKVILGFRRFFFTANKE